MSAPIWGYATGSHWQDIQVSLVEFSKVSPVHADEDIGAVLRNAIHPILEMGESTYVCFVALCSIGAAGHNRSCAGQQNQAVGRPFYGKEQPSGVG